MNKKSDLGDIFLLMQMQKMDKKLHPADIGAIIFLTFFGGLILFTHIICFCSLCFRREDHLFRGAELDPDHVARRVNIKKVDQSPIYSNPYFAEGTELDSECAICLVDFEEGDACRILPSCRHIFHDACVHDWLNKKENCPKCRTQCSKQSKEKIIYFSREMTINSVGVDVV